MKIAILINNMLSSGGIERVTANLANMWAKKHKVIILTTHKDTTSFYPLCNSVQVKSLNIQEPYRSPLGILKWLANVVVSLIKFSRNEQINILLGVWTSMGVCVSLAGKFLNCKTIACEHISFQYTKKSLKALRRLFYPLADAIITLTEHDRKSMSKINTNSICIPNFIDFDEQRHEIEYDAKIVLAIGHVVHRKGFDLLVEAWANIHEKYSDWKLIIVGEIKESDNISSKIYSIIQDKNIRSIEFVPPTKKIEQYYLNSSVFVLSSRYEGLPMVLLEAMGLGLPVVSFDCPTGPNEIIKDGETGFLVPYLNVDILSQSLSKLLENKELRRNMGIAARRDVRNRYSKEQMKEKWDNLLNQMGAL